MYKIKLKGSKKAVYLVWSNILGYDLADICETSGDEEMFTMICSISTKHDAVPNQQWDSQAWDGTIIDQSAFNIDAAINGDYSGQFTDKELVVLSGMFGVEISVFGIPEDQWWLDAEMDPQYPFYEFKNGEEVTNDTICSVDDALELGFVTSEDLGADWAEEDWDEE